jgi:hypothetical protein
MLYFKAKIAKIKDTRDINEVIILILSFHAHCFYKVNNNITQRRKSFVKSKTLTEKVRSPVPDNISVQRSKNMIKPFGRHRRDWSWAEAVEDISIRGLVFLGGKQLDFKTTCFKKIQKMLYFKAKIAKHGKMKNDKDEIWNIHIFTSYIR